MTKREYIYGIHAVLSVINHQHRTVYVIYVTGDRQDKRIHALLALAEQRGIAIQRLSVHAMDERFPDCVHQGVVAEAGSLPEYTERDMCHLLEGKTNSFVLLLDGVTDPHNLGACLRSADAAGVDFVVIPKDKSASITPVVSRVACGAAESIPLIRVTNLVRAMEQLKQQGVWIFGADGEATTSMYGLDFKASIALVMGAEGVGLRRLTRDHCDGLFAMPMHGTVSSLNVSVATGVALYEVVRQRQT
jgi:23S rRNA (guanosine2251-2'-O)-methyltransferase